MSTLTFEQFEQLVNTNVLTDVAMLVRNTSQPRGLLAFNVLGSDFKMKDVILPADSLVHDLTLYAPLQNLLASSDLRAIVKAGQIKILNSAELPQPEQSFPVNTTVNAPIYDNATAITGIAIDGAQVIVTQGEKIWVAVALNNAFSVAVDDLVLGDIAVTIQKENYISKHFYLTVVEHALLPVPVPTIDPTSFYDEVVTGTTLPSATVSVLVDGVSVGTDVADAITGAFSVTVPALTKNFVVSISADDHSPLNTNVSLAKLDVNLTVVVPHFLDNKVTVNLPAQNQAVGITVDIDGQAQIVETIPASATTHDVACDPIRGSVVVKVVQLGYNELTVTKASIKNEFGAVAINPVHAEDANVSGTIVLRTGSNDVSAELVTIDNTYTAPVNANGTFSIPTATLNAGEASLTFRSAYYEEATEDFDVLGKAIPNPTFETVYEGDTTVAGTTLAGVKVVIGTAEETADSNGDFILTLDAPAATGTLTATLSKTNYETRTAPVTVLALLVQAAPTATPVYAGETVISGTAEASAIIMNGANSLGTVGTNGQYSVTVPAMTANTNVVLDFTKDNYAPRQLTVTPLALQTFVKPALTVTEGDTTISGTTIAGTTVASDAATAAQTSDATTGAFTLTLKAAATAAQAIQITLSKRGYTNATFDYVAATIPDVPNPTIDPDSLQIGSTTFAGSTVGNANVSIDNEGSIGSDVADTDGTFSFAHAALTAGNLDVTISATGYKTKTFNYTIA